MGVASGGLVVDVVDKEIQQDNFMQPVNRSHNKTPPLSKTA